MKSRFTAAIILACLSATTFAEEFVPLFDGKTLKGWKVMRCEAVVDDGTILLKDGNGVVATEERYADYVLELEWLALNEEKWDSGIYFRCELPGETGRPWPTRYQANLLTGQEGNVGGIEGATSEGLIKKGEWNKFRLKVVGTKCELEINGKPAWKADGLEDAEGHICLQSEVAGGGQFRFRNIRIATVSD